MIPPDHRPRPDPDPVPERDTRARSDPPERDTPDPEIRFDEIQYREPTPERRPDRDPKLALVAYGAPRANDLPVFLSLRAADAMERHALRDTSVELGGVLLGKECRDPETGQLFVRVEEALEATRYQNTQASFTYTHDSWESLTRERERRFPHLDVVGWYHTHPDFGIFLSGHDRFLHGNYFPRPLQVAYVIDPVRQTRGFFQWRDGDLPQIGGFHIVARRADRAALTRFVNELENVPNEPGVGAFLSPRLEAELARMISQRGRWPAPGPNQPSDPSSVPAALLPLAILAGFASALVVLVFAWLLLDLRARIDDQARTLEQVLAQQQARAEDDALALQFLARVADPEQARALLADEPRRVARERDQARAENRNLREASDVKDARIVELTSRNAELAARNDQLANRLEALRQRLDDTERAAADQAEAARAPSKSGEIAQPDPAAPPARSLVENLLRWAAPVLGVLCLALTIALIRVTLRNPSYPAGNRARARSDGTVGTVHARTGDPEFEDSEFKVVPDPEPAPRGGGDRPTDAPTHPAAPPVQGGRAPAPPPRP